MTWQKLLAARRAKRHKTSRQELDGLRAVVERDLKDAAVAGLSEDRRFATAYNAVLQLATKNLVEHWITENHPNLG